MGAKATASEIFSRLDLAKINALRSQHSLTSDYLKPSISLSHTTRAVCQNSLNGSSTQQPYHLSAANILLKCHWDVKKAGYEKKFLDFAQYVLISWKHTRYTHNHSGTLIILFDLLA